MEKKNFCSVFLRSLEPDSFNSDILSTTYQAAPYLPCKLVNDVEEQIPQRRGANATSVPQRVNWILMMTTCVKGSFDIICRHADCLRCSLVKIYVYDIKISHLPPSHHYSYTNCPDHKEKEREKSTQGEGYMGGGRTDSISINEKEKKKEITKRSARSGRGWSTRDHLRPP
ncbi:hypothetical protein CEXT_415251 [Caerostris extrusa]|uniref:Uncharacterized protein n=1 Tax=Caerostris extrusa TaxID=172846 RepID=A0AAV4MSS3_CAEEX|nr:hypothetical protein CEXT_415251 [Caerostris extrusa]